MTGPFGLALIVFGFLLHVWVERYRKQTRDLHNFYKRKEYVEAFGPEYTANDWRNEQMPRSVP